MVEEGFWPRRPFVISEASARAARAATTDADPEDAAGGGALGFGRNSQLDAISRDECAVWPCGRVQGREGR